MHPRVHVRTTALAAMLALALTAVRVLHLFAPLFVAAALSGAVIRYDLVHALRRPIDGGRSWRGRRLLGDSKTWRGVVVAVVGCAAAALVQKPLAAHVPAVCLIDYRDVEPLWFGAAMGAGAMLGELPNSFVKRRLGIPPGATAKGWRGALFYVWDQVDLLTGAWPAMLPWVRPHAFVVVVSFLLALAVHPLVAAIGFAMGARKTAR